MPLNPGQVLNNRYRIVKLLGQGGMGAVYKAWDLNLERPRALKENLDSSPEAQRQFKREAQMLSDLTHPNLPKVIDHFSLPGQGQYLVMEYVEGEDLGEMLKRLGGPLPEAQAAAWIAEACSALGYLHSQPQPVIHRDIKPANLKITPQGKVMLVDFGIAKVFDPNLSTTVGARAVTPGFSPPEQYGRGGHTTPATDIYALGATLYILLTGQEPVESTLRIGRDPLLPPRQLNPSISLPIAAAIEKAMQLDPLARFQSAAELAAALRPAPRPAPQPAPTPVPLPPTVVVTPPSRPTARPAWFYPAWIGGLAALVVAGVLLYRAINPPATQATQEPAPAEPTLILPTDTLFSPTEAFPSPTDTALLPTDTLPPLPTDPADSSIPPANPRLGDSWIRPSDGMRMLFIPAGQFLMGADPNDADASDDEKPQHPVELDGYWIDQTEVTNAMFTRFVDATGYRTRAEVDGSGWAFNLTAKSWQDTQGADWRHPHGPSSSINGLDDHPVVQISWDDAVAYCQWAGGRLPTEAEWEKAAGWDEAAQTKRKYPWGNEPPAGNLLNFADRNLDVSWADQNIDDGYQFTSPVGSYPAGASFYGLLDMAGNVWEWVQDWYSDIYYQSSPTANPRGPETGDVRVLRGGAWSYRAGDDRVAERDWNYPNNRNGYSGFRCSR